jgi:DNA modification methylase
MRKNQYGGDPNIQINKTKSKEEFRKSLIKFLNNMSDALSDNGNILFIIPNLHSSIESIADIIRDTDLLVYNIIIWDFEKNKILENKYSTNLILHIRKNINFEYPGQKLDISSIEQGWFPWTNDLSKYNDLGFVYDAFPIRIADVLIKSFSKEGDTVADIFGGTGTTAISSLKNNRKAIYNDASIDQFNLAKKRVYDTIGYNTDNDRQEDMAKEEVVQIMLDSVNNDNRGLCKQGGMSDADTEAQIAQSQPSLMLICSNLYDVLKQKEIIA